jgi:hypothetical protein
MCPHTLDAVTFQEYAVVSRCDGPGTRVWNDAPLIKSVSRTSGRGCVRMAPWSRHATEGFNGAVRVCARTTHCVRDDCSHNLSVIDVDIVVDVMCVPADKMLLPACDSGASRVFGAVVMIFAGRSAASHSQPIALCDGLSIRGFERGRRLADSVIISPDLVCLSWTSVFMRLLVTKLSSFRLHFVAVDVGVSAQLRRSRQKRRTK